MTECHPAVSQDLADEQPAVALARLPLAAKQRDPMLTSTAQEALNCHLESWLLGHAVVASVAVLVVILLKRWPAAELLPEEEIASAGPAKRRVELLDSPDPTAYKARGGFVSSQPYFETTTISLEPGEHQVIDMVAATHHHFCRYTFAITVLDGDKLSTETLNDEGKPFEVSALARGASSPPFSHYRSAYIGGVVTSNGLFMPVSPHYRLP
jgi:hypothetical protein